MPTRCVCRLGDPSSRDRQPDDDRADFVFGRELLNHRVKPLDRLGVGRPALDGLQRARKRAGRVADRHADTSLAQIDADDAHRIEIAAGLVDGP